MIAPPASTRRFDITAALRNPEVLVALALAMVVMIRAPLNTDTAYCLVAGRRLLEGSRLYVDLIETNPPMIFWLMAALASVGRHVLLSDAELVGAFTATCLLLSGMTVLWVWAVPPRESRATQFLIVFAFVAGLVLPFVTWTGQREQIAAMLFLPYVAIAVRRTEAVDVSKALSIWSGLLGSIGLAIKPFFLAAWVAVELMVWLLTGKLALRKRPELWAFLLFQAIFAGLVLTVTREYVTKIVPLARAFYPAYGESWRRVVSGEPFAILAAIGAIAIAYALMFSSDPRLRRVGIWGGATLGWLVAFVVQKKGWYYHLLPASAYGTVAFALLAADLRRAFRARPEPPYRIAVLAFSLVALGVALWTAPRLVPEIRSSSAILRHPQPASVLSLVDFVEAAAQGQPVYFMSTSVWPAFPVINMSGTKWPYHYHFLWPIPALYATQDGKQFAYRRPERQGRLEREFFDTVVSDIVKVPPKVLVVDHRADQQAMRGRTFDFVEYFRGSKEFETLMQRYHAVGFIGSWEVYERR